MLPCANGFPQSEQRRFLSPFSAPQCGQLTIFYPFLSGAHSINRGGDDTEGGPAAAAALRAGGPHRFLKASANITEAMLVAPGSVRTLTQAVRPEASARFSAGRSSSSRSTNSPCPPKASATAS